MPLIMLAKGLQPLGTVRVSLLSEDALYYQMASLASDERYRLAESVQFDWLSGGVADALKHLTDTSYSDMVVEAAMEVRQAAAVVHSYLGQAMHAYDHQCLKQCLEYLAVAEATERAIVGAAPATMDVARSILAWESHSGDYHVFPK